MRTKESKKTSRIIERDNIKYYEYRDTAMVDSAPYRPEWIKQLQVVNDNSTKNKNLKWNKGHLLHQFTYFNGEVNFYYKISNKKKVSIMNTGDSMFISPYVPHTFTSRNQESNAHIIAVTFSDKIDTSIQNEISNYDENNLKDFIFKRNSAFKKKVTIKKYNSKKNKFINKNGKKILSIKSLANNPIIQNSYFLELLVLSKNNKIFSDNYHRYIYVLENKSSIKINNKTLRFNKGDSIYIKPFNKICYLSKNSKFLLIKLESKLNNDVVNQIQKIGKENFNRIVKDNKQWF